MLAIDYLFNEYKPFDDLEKTDLASLRAAVQKYGAAIYDFKPAQPLITASAMIVNPEFTKVLVMYHKLHGTFRQFGGKADGNPDLASVAAQELREESGSAAGKLLSPNPIDIIRWNMPERTKNGIFYPAADCFDILFLFSMPETAKFKPAKNEVSGIKWISMEEWRDYHDGENACVKANPSERLYNQRTYKKMVLINNQRLQH